tara:strand:+ start:379 stop:1173 length:795 start_codon:yes stop_codon:yes gene_type:complete
MSQMAGDMGSISMARNNNPESYQNFLDNFGSVNIFTGKPHAPYTGPTQEEFEAEERARLGDDVSQPNTTGGLGGLGSIFDIIKNQMPAPPVSDGGPILGRGPRSMQFIDENRNGIDDRDEENVTPLPSPFKQLPRGPFEGGPMPSRPQMPAPDLLQKLQEALKQKQSREMPQKRPPRLRDNMMRKRPQTDGLAGMLQKLATQAAQKAEQPQMPARPQSRGGMFGKIARSPTRGGSGGILPRAGNGPTPEQIRSIMRNIDIGGLM